MPWHENVRNLPTVALVICSGLDPHLEDVVITLSADTSCDSITGPFYFLSLSSSLRVSPQLPLFPPNIIISRESIRSDRQ
jgi:hypothetical protein